MSLVGELKEIGIEEWKSQLEVTPVFANKIYWVITVILAAFADLFLFRAGVFAITLTIASVPIILLFYTKSAGSKNERFRKSLSIFILFLGYCVFVIFGGIILDNMVVSNAKNIYARMTQFHSKNGKYPSIKSAEFSDLKFLGYPVRYMDESGSDLYILFDGFNYKKMEINISTGKVIKSRVGY